MSTDSFLEIQLCTPGAGMDVFSQLQVRQVERQDLADPGLLPFSGMLWQADLPRNSYTARRSLQQHRRCQTTALHALPHAGQRLELYTSQVIYLPGSSEQYGYDLEQEESDLPEPERALHAWIASAQQGQSYGILDDLKEAGQQIASLYQMLARLGKDDDLINTHQAGRLIGCSKVTWLGDIDTYLAPGVPGELILLHQQHLRACLQARILWLRIGLMTTSFAVRLAASLAIPMNPITTAKRILLFIKQVFDEYKRLSQTAPDQPD